MKIYYVSIHYRIPYTFMEYDKTYYFNSENNMKKWIENFEVSTLNQITSYGEARFNKNGILIP